MSDAQQYRIVPFHSKLKTGQFDCGVEPLNVYLQKFAGQNQRRGVSRTYVLIDASGTIAGYYNVSMAELAFDQLPESARQRLPRYPIPAMRIGRLAVSLSHRGMGFGEKLLVDALNLALRLQNDVGLYAVIVDAKDETATRFYEYFGFIRLHEQERLLFLPIATIAMT